MGFKRFSKKVLLFVRVLRGFARMYCYYMGFTDNLSFVVNDTAIYMGFKRLCKNVLILAWVLRGVVRMYSYWNGF